jgi:hypothetical protein
MGVSKLSKFKIYVPTTKSKTLLRTKVLKLLAQIQKNSNHEKHIYITFTNISERLCTTDIS